MRYKCGNSKTFKSSLACEITYFSKIANCDPTSLLNLITCTKFRICYSIPEADPGPP